MNKSQNHDALDCAIVNYTKPPCDQGHGEDGNCIHFKRCMDCSLACEDLSNYLNAISAGKAKTISMRDDMGRLPTADRFDTLYAED